MKRHEIKMKGLMIERPVKMGLRDLPLREYGIDDVLIKVAFCGICGSDLEAFDVVRQRRKGAIKVLIKT